ncbi:hypothetical protein NECAME_15671 [Necator americanus]|uniref:Uncharacterized protein n=1 Tax=Necator americanus TaxID=51031 RepID=W2SGG7_NECAM|nr:hypothetical protein NECAME_15671 [Necator americanus]ETN68719.1 hypothetical protein NECAME_15671 [Necator americanus]
MLKRYEDHSDIATTIRFLSQESTAFSTEVTQSMTTTVEHAIAATTNEEAVGSTIAARLRILLNESIRALTDEVTYESFQTMPASSAIATLLVTLYSLESVIAKVSEPAPSATADVSVGQLQRTEQIQETQISLAERRRLQLIHVVKATSEERAELVRALERYQQNREISEVLRILERSNVVLSQRITSQMISILEENRSVRTAEAREEVVEKLRETLTHTVQLLTEPTTYAMWRTSEQITSLSTLVLTVASIERVVANFTAPEEVQTEVETSLRRETAEVISKILSVTTKSTQEARLGADSTTESITLINKEIEEASMVEAPQIQTVQSSSVVREYGNDAAEANVIAGVLASPPPEAEEASIVRKMQQVLFLRCAIKASQEQQEQLTASMFHALDEESTSKVVKVIKEQGTGLSACATSEIQSALDKELFRTGESEEVQGQSGERIKAALTRCIGALTDETVHTLWKTATKSEMVELVKSLVLLEGVVLDTFEPTEAATELVKMLRREEPKQLLTKLMTAIEQEFIERTFTYSRIQQDVRVRGEEAAQEILRQFPDQHTAAAKKAIREYGEESANVGIKGGILEIYAKQEETTSTYIRDRRRILLESTMAAATYESAETHTNITHPEDVADFVASKQMPVTITSSLSALAYSDSQITSDLSIRAAEQDSTLSFTAKDRIKVEDAVSTKQTSEETEHGIWETAQKAAFSEITLTQKAKEFDQMQTALQASTEKSTEIEQTLANLQQEFAEMQIATKQKQSDIKDFSIANESQEVELEKKQSMAGEFAKIPEVSRSATTSNAHEFVYEAAGTLFTHGYLQTRPQEQATAESTFIQDRRLVDVKTVSASQDESVERSEELKKDVRTADTTEKTTATSLLDTSSLSLRASQEEHTIKTVEYYKREQRYDVGRTQAEKQRLAAKESTQEVGEEAAYGIWRTVEGVETEVSLPNSERKQEQLSASIHASTEETVATSSDFQKMSSAEALSTVNLDRTDSTAKMFSVEQQRFESRFTQHEAQAERSTVIADVTAASDVATMHEYGLSDIQVGGALGHLAPKKSESAEAAVQIPHTQRLETFTKMAASTEITIEKTDAIGKAEAMESTVMREVISNKEEAQLSTPGMTVEQAVVDFNRKRGSTSYGVGKSMSATSIEAAQITSKETSVSSVFGIWDSGISIEDSQKTIRETSVESSDVTLSLRASETEAVLSEVELLKQPTDYAMSLVKDVRKEEGRRGFSIEELDVTTSYQRCAMGEIAVTTEKDIVVVSSTGSATEFAKEQAGLVAVLGSIEPPLEEFKSVSVKLEASKKLELESMMKATEEVSTETQSLLQKEEMNMQSERTVKETTTEQEMRGIKASEFSSADQTVSLISGGEKGESDVQVTDRIVTASTAKMQESTQEDVQGIWRTPSGAETTFTLKEKEVSVEKRTLSTKASLQEDVLMSEEKIHDVSAKVERIMVEKEHEDASRKYFIASEALSKSVEKSGVEAVAGESISEKRMATTAGKFREFSKEETVLGLVAHTIEAPRGQHEEQSISIRTSSTIRLGENMEASKEQFADQPVMLTKMKIRCQCNTLLVKSKKLSA